MAEGADFTEEQIKEFKATFAQFDADSSGSITVDELAEVFKRLGENVPGYKLRDMIAEVDTDNSKTIEFSEFVAMMKKVRQSGGKFVNQFATLTRRVENLTKVGGSSTASAADTTHTYSEEETVAFSDWINYALKDDADLAKVLPISAKGLFDAVKDGIVLCKLINSSVANTIDERAINKKKLNTYNIGENQTLALNSAAAIGCNVVNIGADDLMQGTGHLVLGLMWQIIRAGLFANINLQKCPGLQLLLQDGEDISSLLALGPEAILLRWVNYHLKNAGQTRQIKNFSGDISDSEAYIFLLKQIAPRDSGVDTRAMTIMNDLNARAEAMLESAEKINCRKFVRAKDVTSGNAKLNLAFVALLFNKFPALDGDFGDVADFELGNVEETREERTFRNWMNSLGVKPFVNVFYSDLGDGHVLLQLEEKIKHGIVDWAKVNQPPYKKFGASMKKIENVNYALDIAKKLNLSIVNVDGKDIYEGNKTLTLGIVWQLMHAYTLTVLEKLSGSTRVNDQFIVDFVNNTLRAAGKTSSIGSFKDPSLVTSMPVIDLIDAIKPGVVDYSLLNAEDPTSNAKYAVSMARKIGAGVYALPEDLVEVKPKMIMTIFACLMARSYGKK